MSQNPEIVDADLRFTEAVAADKLGISKASLMRERIAGRVHPYRIGQRIIRYTDAILNEYLESCRNVPDKSANTGSVSGQDRTRGAEHGSTPKLDRRSAHHLAQAIFKRQK